MEIGHRPWKPRCGRTSRPRPWASSPKRSPRSSTPAANGVCSGETSTRDVILLSWFLAHVERAEWDERTPRLLSVLVDGLRVR